MQKMAIVPAVAVLMVLLSAITSGAVRSDSWEARGRNRSFVWVGFTPGQLVGPTVGDVCANSEFASIFRADLDRIACSLPIREIEIVGVECNANAALIMWASRSPRLSARLESALKALPYVQFLARGLAGNPDGQVTVRLTAADGLHAGVRAESPRRARSWGAIKIRYH